jgi:hypothetical protein
VTALPGLDRPALLDAFTTMKLRLASVASPRYDMDALTRAELVGRLEVIEALLGRRELAALIAEYRPSFRPDPLPLDRHHVAPYDLRQHAAYGALDEYMRWVEHLPDFRRCGYSGCGAPLMLGVDDVYPGAFDAVFCSDLRGCFAEHRLSAAMTWSGR